MKFRLREKPFEVMKEEVLRVLKDKVIEENNSRYYVRVDDTLYPIKPALMEVLRSKGINLTPLDFTTQDAVRIFRKLGFEIIVKGKKKKNLDDLVGVIKEGENFNAVADKERLYT